MDWQAVLAQAKALWDQYGFIVTAVTGVAAVVTAGFAAIRYLTRPRSRALTAAIAKTLPKAAPGTLNILVFDLADDDAGKTPLTSRLVTSLDETYRGHANVRRARCFVPLPAREKQIEREREAWELVALALKMTGFDAAVWGQADGKRDVIFPIVQAKDATPPDFAAKGFKLGDGLEVPAGAIAGVGPLIAARISAEAAPAYDGGRYMADVLAPVAERLERLLAPAPAWLDADAKGRGWNDLGTALRRVGEQGGADENLLKAVSAYREALKEYTRDRVPLQWATTQNNLGAALQTLGARETGTARLDEAVDAYREALKEYTRDRVPLDWAMTQSNLGAALATLGERDTGTAWLDEAVAAFREALKERTRDRAPLQWAMTQNNLGAALQALGARETGTARLDEAVDAFREALKERTRDRVPLDWALTQNNLGAALQALGERETGTARLDEAVAAFREALKEYTRDRVPLLWATTQNNLGNALQTLGARETGTARLDEAVDAYREALKEYTRDRVPLDWAATQFNLALVFGAKGDKGVEPAANSRQAIVLIDEALTVFRSAGATQYAAQAEGLRARVSAKLAGG